MKLFHLSDLHLGKRVYDYSMIEDQRYILDKILSAVGEERPDGVLISGDVYDKATPTSEAMELFDSFLFALSGAGVPVFIISGNHDSQERLSFGARLMEGAGIFISRTYCGRVDPITLEDSFGKVNIYLLPFVKPSQIRRFHDEPVESYTDGMRAAISSMEIDQQERSILLCHQFVSGGSRTESEEISVGGTDNVDPSVFEPFDYVALGHLHRAQSIGKKTVRYCGTPLKYSFSEARDKKSITVVELYEKGRVEVREIPLTPMREMVELRGDYDRLMERNFWDGTTYPEDYVHITLTDEEDVIDAYARLGVIYKNMMKLDYDNERTRRQASPEALGAAEKKTPLEHFSDLFLLQNNKEMTAEQKEFVSELIEKIWEGEA